MRYLFPILLLLFNAQVWGQSNTKMLLGNNGYGLDFSTYPPEQIKCLLRTHKNAIVHQNINNEIVFYSNGDSIWDGNGNGMALMPSSTLKFNANLFNYVSIQNLNYVNYPKYADTFYILTSGRSTRGVERLGFQRIVHSKVLKTIKILDTLPIYKSILPIETVIVIPHKNQKDYWIIGSDNSNYYVYLFDENGLNLKSNYKHNEIYETRKICVANAENFWLSLNFAYYEGPKIIMGSVLNQYSFDNSIGEIKKTRELFHLTTEQLKIEGEKTINNLCLSQNDSFLYLSDGFYNLNKNEPEKSKRYYQLYLADSILDYLPLHFDKFVVNDNMDMQLCPNNQILIYSTEDWLVSTDRGKKSFHRIKYPNRKGAACKLEHDAVRYREKADPNNPTDFFSFPIKSWKNRQFEFKYDYSCKNGITIIPLIDSSIKTLSIFINNDTFNIGAKDSLFFILDNNQVNVLMHAKNAMGDYFWFEDSIFIDKNWNKPTAKFSVTDTTGCQWVGYHFKNESDVSYKYKPINYTWQFGQGKDTTLQFAQVPNALQSSVSHTYTQSGLYKVNLIVNDGYCADTFTLQNKVTILPAPQPGMAANPMIGCSPLQITAQRQYTDPIDSLVWQWEFGQTTTMFTNPALANHTYFHTFNTTQTFKLVQTLFGPTGCITSDTQTIAVKPGFEVDYTPKLIRASVENDNITLIQWQGHSHAAQYHLFKNNALLANTTDTFFIEPFNQFAAQNPVYHIAAANSCEELSNQSNIGQLILLQGQTQNNKVALLQWTAYQDWPNGIANYTIEAKNNGIFTTLSQTDTLLHTDNDFIQSGLYERCYRITAIQFGEQEIVSHSNTLCLGYESVIFVPNAFSPNNDGLNDIFEPFNIGFKSYTLSIYNRWGEKIAEGKNWDGTIKGQTVPNGLYFYRITGKTGKNEHVFLNGEVVVVR